MVRNCENPDLREAVSPKISKNIGRDKSVLTKELVEYCLGLPEVADYFKRVKRLRDEYEPESKQLRVELEKRYQASARILEVAKPVAKFLFNGVEQVGDKLPAYGGVFPRILEKLAGTKIILTMRDPLQVARSFLKDREWDPWWETDVPQEAVQLGQ